MRFISVAFLVLCTGFFLLSMKSGKTAVKLGENQFLVISVQGRILFEKSGSEMKRGDTYITGTALSFMTSTSRAAVGNKTDGRFVITANKKNKLTMLPAVNPVASRSAGILNLVDLKNHFAGKLMIIEEAKYQIGETAFPQTDKSYFYVKYNYNGTTIPKKLGHDGSYLIINKSELFKVDGESIPVEEKEMILFYRNEDKSYKITTFIPVFPDTEVLKQEMGYLFSSCSFETQEAKYSAAVSFATEFYGKPERINFYSWLEKEFEEDLNINE